MAIENKSLGHSKMRFFKDIRDAFNGNARKRYNETHNSMLNILNKNHNSSILYYGHSLNSDQKFASMLFIKGCFNSLVVMYDVSNGNMDISDSMKRTNTLAQLFLKDKLRWKSSDIIKTEQTINNVSYHSPQILEPFVAIGMGVILHTLSKMNQETALIMGYDINVSPEEGQHLLDEFFNILNKKVGYGAYSEKIRQKNVWHEVNTSHKYIKLLKPMIMFESTQTMMMFSLNMKNLTPDEYKKIILYFGGVADYVAQGKNFTEEESMKLIAFYLCSIIYENNYTKIFKVFEDFVELSNTPSNIEIIHKGVDAFQKTLHADNRDELDMIIKSESGLYKVLSQNV